MAVNAVALHGGQKETWFPLLTSLIWVQMISVMLIFKIGNWGEEKKEMT